MYKSSDYNNSNNYWQPNNNYNNAPNQNFPPPQFPLSAGPPPPPPMFSQPEYNQSQQIQSRTGETTNLTSVPPAYSNSGYSQPESNSGYSQPESNSGYSQPESEDISKRNVTYPPPGQYLQSNYGHSKDLTRENTNRHNAFPPPSMQSNFNHPQAGSSDTTNERCPRPSWNYGHSKSDGLDRQNAYNEFNSYNKQSNTFTDSVSNSYGSPNQYGYQGPPNNENSSHSYGNYQVNNNTNNPSFSYEFSGKANMQNNSGYSNSRMNHYQDKPDSSCQPFSTDYQTNFERAHDVAEADSENSNNNENAANDIIEDNSYQYNSPLNALEDTRGNNNEPSLSVDNRRPPPIEIDPSLPQEISAQFKTSSCNLCGVKLNSRVQAKMHYEGRPHSKKVKQAVNDIENKANPSSTTEEESSPPKKKKSNVDASQLYCKCCDLSLTSTNHATQHYLGRNHHRVLHGLKPLQAGYYNKETGQWQRTPPDPVTSTEQLGLDDKDDSIADSVKHKGKFFCELCGVAATSQEQLDGHLIGQKHTKKLKALKQAESTESSAAEGSEGSILASVIAGDVAKKTKPKDLSIFRTPSGKASTTAPSVT